VHSAETPLEYWNDSGQTSPAWRNSAKIFASESWWGVSWCVTKARLRARSAASSRARALWVRLGSSRIGQLALMMPRSVASRREGKRLAPAAGHVEPAGAAPQILGDEIVDHGDLRAEGPRLVEMIGGIDPAAVVGLVARLHADEPLHDGREHIRRERRVTLLFRQVVEHAAIHGGVQVGLQFVAAVALGRGRHVAPDVAEGRGRAGLLGIEDQRQAAEKPVGVALMPRHPVRRALLHGGEGGRGPGLGLDLAEDFRAVSRPHPDEGTRRSLRRQVGRRKCGQQQAAGRAKESDAPGRGANETRGREEGELHQAGHGVAG
jgi:hypothetical protein